MVEKKGEQEVSEMGMVQVGLQKLTEGATG